MTDCEYVKLNTSIQTGSNAGGLSRDEDGNIEAMVELRLPDNLFSNNEPRRRISKVEMETSKLRVSMENTPIAQLPLDTTVDQSLVKYNLSTAELGVYPFVVVGNENKIYPDVTDEESVSSFALYKQHKTKYILRACTDVDNETFVTFAQYQTTAYAYDFPKTSPYYEVLKKNKVFQAVVPGFALSFPEAKIENGKLYIHNVKELEKAIASALEYAVTYACTQDNEDMYVDFVTTDQAVEAGVDTDTASSVYVDSLSQTVYFWKYWIGGDSGATSSLLAGFKPTVQISGQSLTIKYDTAGFTNVVPVLFNSEYIQTYEYPFQMNIDIFRQSLWYKPPPKRMYKYGVGTDGDPPAYDYRLLLDMQAAVFNIIGNKAMRDSLSFLPWKKVNLSQVDVPRSARYLVETSKESSYSVTGTEHYEYRINDYESGTSSVDVYSLHGYLNVKDNVDRFTLPLSQGQKKNVWLVDTLYIKSSLFDHLVLQYRAQYSDFDTTPCDSAGDYTSSVVGLTAAVRFLWNSYLSPRSDPDSSEEFYWSSERQPAGTLLNSEAESVLECNFKSTMDMGTTAPTVVETYYSSESLTPGTSTSEVVVTKTVPQYEEVNTSDTHWMMTMSVADNVWCGNFRNGVTDVESLHYAWYSTFNKDVNHTDSYRYGICSAKPFICHQTGVTEDGFIKVQVKFIVNLSETPDSSETYTTANAKYGTLSGVNTVDYMYIRGELTGPETITITQTVTAEGTAPSIEYIPNLTIDAQKDDFYILDANTADLTIGQPEVTNNGPVINSGHKFKIVEEVIEEVIGKSAHDEYLGTWGTGPQLATGTQPRWQMHIDPIRYSDVREYDNRTVYNESREYTEHRYYLVDPETGVADMDHLLGAWIDFTDALYGTSGPESAFDSAIIPSVPANAEPPLGIWGDVLTNIKRGTATAADRERPIYWSIGNYYVDGVAEEPRAYVEDALMYDTAPTSVPFNPSKLVSRTVSYYDEDDIEAGVTSTISTTERESTTVKSTSAITPMWDYTSDYGFPIKSQGVPYPYVVKTSYTPYIPGVNHGILCVYKHNIGAWENVELNYEHFHVYNVDTGTFEKYWVPTCQSRYSSYWERFEGLPEHWVEMMNRPSWGHYISQISVPQTAFFQHITAADGRYCQTETFSIRDSITGREYQIYHVWADLMVDYFAEKIRWHDTNVTETNIIIPGPQQPMNYYNPGFDHLCLVIPDIYFIRYYPADPVPSSGNKIYGRYKVVEKAVSTVRRTTVRTVIDIRPQLAGNVQLTYTWNELPMVVMSPIASIILTLDGINFTSEIQPYNMTTPGAGSSLTQTIPVAENYYSLAQTLRDLHDELVVTRADFDSNAKYTLERNCGDERTIRLTAHYLSKDGTLHKIYIPPNGVFAIQLTFRISYYYI